MDQFCCPKVDQIFWPLTSLIEYMFTWVNRLCQVHEKMITSNKTVMNKKEELKNDIE